jgi:hypothetical protein
MNRHTRYGLFLLVFMLTPFLAAPSRIVPAPSRVEDLSTLRSAVDDLLREGKYDEVAGRLEATLREAGNEELRQYALLQLGEVRLIFQRNKTAAIGPLEDLVTEYLPTSPYVQKAHYHLGSIYVETGDASKAFQHLRHIDEASSDHSDALVKLEWAARNLKTAVVLPMGVNVNAANLGAIAMALDLIFTLLWIAQTVFSKLKTPVVFVVLIALVLAKLLASIYLQRMMAIYS